MDDHESSSIIMMLALWALLGVITLICWCRELWQERAAIRWATQPLVDSADKGNGLESVQHGLRDADMDLAAATDQAISLSLRQCELAVQDLIAIGSAEEKPGHNDRPLVDSADKGDGLESVQHGLRDADMDSAAFYGTSTRRLAAPLARSTFSLICRPADFQAAQTTTRRR